jgi:sigma-B regulation protein RsbU (phosphoserine phosphatase)
MLDTWFFSHFFTEVKIMDLLIEEILDSMYDWVRVLDRNDNIVYANKAMTDALNTHLIGRKCYETIGRSSPCENCISRKAVFYGKPHEKEERIGSRVFSVMSTPLKNKKEEVMYVVEVLRDITELKALQIKTLEQNKKLQNDLSLARKLQCSMLPVEIQNDRLSFSFIYKPCETLGGDFLDIFRIDDDHVGIYIADVSGHGVSASMLTIFLRSAINKNTLSPSLALGELYKSFGSHNFGQDLYITVFYAVINTRDLKMTYSNAGHNVPTIVFNKDRFELLRVPGIPISDWVDEPVYQDKTIQLEKEDMIFFFTDGIVEMRSKTGEEFGEERLLKLLNTGIEPAAVLNNIISSLYDFAGIDSTQEIPDDVTMALLKIN